MKSATSESANYHAARRGRSRPEFIAKLGIVVEEADETEHWLAVIQEAKFPLRAELEKELPWLKDEAGQLRAIFVASVMTARHNAKKKSAR